MDMLPHSDSYSWLRQRPVAGSSQFIRVLCFEIMLIAESGIELNIARNFLNLLDTHFPVNYIITQNFQKKHS